MALTDSKIRQTKAQDKDFKLSDEKGLYLLVKTSGAKLWRMKYRFATKEKLLALGSYSEVSLKDAREKRDAARSQLANGIDPSELRKVNKFRLKEATTNSFEAIANEWYTKQRPTWADTTANKRRAQLDKDLIPYLGSRPIAELETVDLLACLRRIEQRGAIDTAHNARQVLNQIFRYAKQTARTKQNPATDLAGAITTKKATHRAAITDPAEFGELLVKIDGYKGSHIVRTLLAIAPLVFQRPGELLAMEWSEVDFDTATWSIPAGKMKMKTAHLVPLSKQVIALLLDLQPLALGTIRQIVEINQPATSKRSRIYFLHRTHDDLCPYSNS